MSEFLNTYAQKTKDKIWQEHSEKFRHFWSGEIEAPDAKPLSDEACDVIIRILNTHGKGNTRDNEAMANTMVPQEVWRRMPKSFQSDRQLASLVGAVLKEEDPKKKAASIDKLYEKNDGAKNRLTGPAGVTINALLAAYDPSDNLTIVSL